MGLAAFKEDFDVLAETMSHAPERPVTHPMLVGVRAQASAKNVLDKIDLWETEVLEWRSDGIAVLHRLRRSLNAASSNGEMEAVHYAVHGTIPTLVTALDDMQGTLSRPWDDLEQMDTTGLAPADKRFFKYLQKRTRDFGRTMAGKLDHLRDQYISLAWDFDPDAHNATHELMSDDDIDAFFASLPVKE